MKNRKAKKTGHSEALEKRLRAYVAGAGAVATGLLALSPPAMAEIVVTRAHAFIGGHGSPFPINVEGTTEFTLATHASRCPVYYNSLTVAAASGAGVVGHGPNHPVAALGFGAPIGPARQFEAGKQLLAFVYVGRFGSPFVSGPFANVTDRFLGLKFELNGQVYYGWAGFSEVTANSEFCSVTATLTAYAYETEPNTPIYAGQSSDLPAESRLLPSSGPALETARARPATLGVLALGSLGLNAWRKRETREPDASGQCHIA